MTTHRSNIPRISALEIRRSSVVWNQAMVGQNRYTGDAAFSLARHCLLNYRRPSAEPHGTEEGPTLRGTLHD